ncbi:NUDIX hydrolase [Streptomyces sp. DT24]|uniref:NUDIX hydrolase n=1 Tax=unclassified Streptomyces TaxID=2593676 RepID=UPI0023B93674|nr:NUDIX hydrolase [Streptomyces sp. AM 4-1-1]WEH32567.1 NUDIX hydrolase [Streptomyces sp. AM 4-1-1]
MIDTTPRWQEISRTTVFEKYGRGIEKVVFQLPDGRIEDFFIKAESSAAAVLALTEDLKVVVAKQFRPGPMDFLYELPGGFISPGEEALVAMERELLEETGYRGQLEHVTTCYDDAYSTVVRHCFVATNCVKIAEPCTEDNEFIEVTLLDQPSFRNILRKGRMSDVEVAYLGLDHLNLL